MKDSIGDTSQFYGFVETIAALRGPDGCPWDKAQTHKSITQNMIEEAFEAVEAIEDNDIDHMREELGDVLLQVVLQSQIAQDAGEFTIDDVISDVNDKIIRRHPHVFGDVKAGSAEEVLKIWDREKLSERQGANHVLGANADADDAGDVDAVDAGAVDAGDAFGIDAPDGGRASCSDAPDGGNDGKPGGNAAAPGLLDGIPRALPSLIQAQKISRKAAACGFDWESMDGIWAKVAEEETELKIAYDVMSATKEGDSACRQAKEDVVEEVGDVLFSLVNVARKMGVNAEEALRATCRKFRERWGYMEAQACDRGASIEALDQDVLEELWEASKRAGL